MRNVSNQSITSIRRKNWNSGLQEGRNLDILVQVNTSAEESKFGCAPGEAETLVKAIATLPHVTIRGFMTIGLFSEKRQGSGMLPLP
ncbi:alanine racemase [Treponema vincentii]|uniref:alanine racemase n=1 Tax=Treponema vincentii TaxID=69710 RepID=UPI001E4577F0|nr:alanine racemase [Treponema vincentii]